jgi:pimeloyl-ACP methyl ester carboxylesterase
VYVPGIDGTGDLLLGTAERIALRMRLLRLGYRLEPGGPAPTYGRLAQSVVDRAREAGMRRFFILTESFGGGVSFQAALDFPEEVAGLLVVNSFARYRRRLSLLLSRWFVPLVPPRLFGIGRALTARYFLFSGAEDPAAWGGFVGLPGAGFGDGYRIRLAMVATLDLRKRLAEVRQPVSLFASERDRIVASVAEAREMIRFLPNATLETLPGGGHVVLPLADIDWVRHMEALASRASGAKPP